jgi:hypothetical protein
MPVSQKNPAPEQSGAFFMLPRKQADRAKGIEFERVVLKPTHQKMSMVSIFRPFRRVASP